MSQRNPGIENVITLISCSVYQHCRFCNTDMFLYAIFQNIVNALTETHQKLTFPNTHFQFRLSVIKDSHSIFEPVKIVPLQCLSAQLLSHVQLFAIPWIVARQAPLSMGFPRQEYWSGLHFLLQGTFRIQGSNLHLLCLLQLVGGYCITRVTGEAPLQAYYNPN